MRGLTSKRIEMPRVAKLSDMVTFSRPISDTFYVIAKAKLSSLGA